MRDEDKTKEQLVAELRELRGRVAEVELMEGENPLLQGTDTFRLIFEQAPLGMSILDLDSHFVRVNKAMCDMLGYSEQELLALTSYDITYPDDIEVSTARVHRQIMTHTLQVFRIEKRFVRKDKRIIWTNATTMMVRDEEGSPLYVVGIIEDISKRKRAEQALRESEARFRTVFEQGPLGMSIVDNEFELLAINPVFCRMLGYTEEELKALTSDGFTHPEDVHIAREYNQRILRNEISSYQVEKRYITKSGEPLWANLTASMTRDENGNPLYGVGMVEDITKRKESERLLREREARFRGVFEKSPLGMSMTNREGYFIQVNAKLCEIVGYTEEELLGMTFLDITYPDDRESDRILAEETIAGIQPVARIEKRYVRKSGEAVWVRVTGAVIRDENGEFLYGIGMTEDITERKLMEDALRRSEEKWRSLVENAPDIITMLDREGTILFANRSVQTTTAQNLVGACIYDFLLPEYQAVARTNVDEVFETGRPRTFEVAGVDDAGEMHWYRSRLGLVELHHEQPLLISISTDITERKHSEQALMRYAQRFRILHEIDRAILEARSAEELSYAALRRIREVIPCKRAGVKIFDFEVSEALVIAADVNGGSALLPGERVPISQIATMPDLYFEELMKNRVWVVDDILRMEDASVTDKQVLGEGVRSYINVALVSHGELIGTLALGAAEPGAFEPEQVEIAREVADQLAIAIQQSRLDAEIQAARQRLQALSSRLVEVQEAERLHLARELHDEVGQILTGLKISLEMSKTLPPESMRRTVDEAQGLVDGLLKRVREMSLNLRPAMLDDLGLLPTLLWHFERYTTHTGIEVRFRHTSVDRRFRPEVEITAYRILQEALTNTARYAAVGVVLVRLWADQDTMNIQVEDSGKGFDVAAALSSGISMGLVGMHERVFALGGTVTIESKPGEGARLIAELPLGGRENES